MIRLLIKGSRFAALEALRERHLARHAAYMAHPSGRAESIYYVPEFCFPAVVSWFSEPGRAPFPPGALLHYYIEREAGGATAAFK